MSGHTLEEREKEKERRQNQQMGGGSVSSEDGKRSLEFKKGTCVNKTGSPSGGTKPVDLDNQLANTWKGVLEPTKPTKGFSRIKDNIGNVGSSCGA